MVALVTGGTGFLGSKVVRALIENGHDKVVAFDLYPNETNLAGVLDRVEIVRGDLSSFTTILNLIETHKPETIHHLGALLAPSETDPEAGIRVNALGTYYLLEAARLFGVSQMIFASSITVISSTDPDAQSLHDYSPTHPETVYAATKLFSENMGRYYRRQHGFDFRGIRLPSVIGPGVKSDGYVQYFNKTIELSAKGSPFEIYVRPDTRLPVVHVDDAAEAFLHLAAAPTEKIKAVVYAIMGPCPTPSAQELVDLVSSKIPGARLSFKVDEYVQRMFDNILRLPLDDRYARQEWGWKPRFELEAIIDDFIAKIPRQSAEEPAL